MKAITWEALAIEAARAWTARDPSVNVSEDLRAELPALILTDATLFDSDKRTRMREEIAKLLGTYGLRQRASAQEGNVVALVFDFTLTDVDHFALRDEMQQLLQRYLTMGQA